jgi:hypothetical protein
MVTQTSLDGRPASSSIVTTHSVEVLYLGNS